MTTKTIDDRGRLALGQAFAGQMVIVDDSDPDRLIITRAKVIPTREAWLYENEKALGMLRRGLAEAKAGEFSGDPPDLSADAKRIGD